LHFLYNLAEETLILIAYIYQLKQLPAPGQSIVALQNSLAEKV